MSWFLVDAGLKVEAAFGQPSLAPADWVDITHDVMSIRTDRPLDTNQDGTASLVLNNRSGKYDPRSGLTYGYCDLPGNASVVSSPVGLSGDNIDVRVKVAVDDWTPAVPAVIAASAAWRLTLLDDGTLQVEISTDGTTWAVTETSATPPGFTDGNPGWIRFTYVRDVGDGTYEVTYFTSTDGVTWTELDLQFGTSVGATFTTAAPIQAGSDELVGKLYRLEVCDGVNGPTITNPDFTFGHTTGTVEFEDGRENTWTLQDDASMVIEGQHRTRRTPIRITARTSSGSPRGIYYGYVLKRGGWKAAYQMPSMATITVACADFFSIVAGIHLEYAAIIPPGAIRRRIFDFGTKKWTFRTIVLSEGDSAGEPRPIYIGYKTGDLLAQLVADERLPTPGPGWQIDPAANTLTTGYWGDENARTWLEQLTESEGGLCYVDRDGAPTFHGRHAVLTNARMTTPQVTFADDGTGVPYSISGFSRDTENELWNRASFTPLGDDQPQTFEDTASIDANTVSEYKRTELFCEATDCLALAWLIVAQYAEPADGIVQFQLDPLSDDQVRDAAVDLELHDRVTVKFTPPYGTDQLEIDHFVERIGHQIDANPGSWTVTVGASPDRFENDNFETHSKYAVVDTAMVDDDDSAVVAF